RIIGSRARASLSAPTGTRPRTLAGESVEPSLRPAGAWASREPPFAVSLEKLEWSRGRSAVSSECYTGCSARFTRAVSGARRLSSAPCPTRCAPRHTKSLEPRLSDAASRSRFVSRQGLSQPDNLTARPLPEGRKSGVRDRPPAVRPTLPGREGTWGL